jgi:hypothetical protein
VANRYSVGDKVMASRDESGENHEPANVIDAYELLIGEDRKPMVVVEFEDGERKYMTATTPNVLPVEEEEEEEEPEDVDDDEAAGQDDEESDAIDEDGDVVEDGEVMWVDDEEGASP